MRRIDMLGKVYGRLTVLEEVEKEVKAVCSCGSIKIYRRGNVLAGYTISCGCFRDEQISKANTRHGHKPNDKETSKTYHSWQAMKKRCDNPNYQHYPRYGGRGITYQESWKDFREFLSDMGNRPYGKELDRIDNNGNYTKANCRWVDHKTNTQNGGY